MIHPFSSQSLPIIFDDFVDMEFGTGEPGAVLWKTGSTLWSFIFPLEEKEQAFPESGLGLIFRGLY